MKKKATHLAFCGFMGAGKSTLATYTAQKLKLPLFSIDKQIEFRCGLSISAIFSRYGEEKFRILEAECLQEALLAPKPHIIDLGGGTPLAADNLALLKEKAHVIYLAAPLEICLKRLAGDTTRPLLKRETSALQKLYNERVLCYEKLAGVTFDATLLITELVNLSCEYFYKISGE